MKLNDDTVAIPSYPRQIVIWTRKGGERIVLDEECLKNLFILAVEERLIDCQKIMSEIYDG